MVKKRTKSGRRRPSKHTRRIKVGPGLQEIRLILINPEIEKPKPVKRKVKPKTKKKKPANKKKKKAIIREKPDEDVSVLLVPIRKEKDEVEVILVPSEDKTRVVEEKIFVPFPVTPKQELKVKRTPISRLMPPDKLKLEREPKQIKVFGEYEARPIEEDKKWKKELKELKKLDEKIEREKLRRKKAFEREQEQVRRQLEQESEIRINKKELKRAKRSLEAGDVETGLYALGVKQKNIPLAMELLQEGNTKAVKGIIKEDRIAQPFGKDASETLAELERKRRLSELFKTRREKAKALKEIEKELKPAPIKKSKKKKEELVVEVLE